MLILGDDASGDGNGYGVPETLSILEQFGNPSKAVLVVNETQVLGNGNIIRLGNAATRAGETGVVFGGGSALLMRGRADAPVFTSAADGSLSFQPNSSIFVVDPFGSNQLTDTTVSEINGRSDVNLVSLNPNLSLKLEMLQEKVGSLSTEKSILKTLSIRSFRAGSMTTRKVLQSTL